MNILLSLLHHAAVERHRLLVAVTDVLAHEARRVGEAQRHTSGVRIDGVHGKDVAQAAAAEGVLEALRLHLLKILLRILHISPRQV